MFLANNASYLTTDMGDGDPILSDFCGNLERVTRGNPDPLHLRVTKFLQALLFVYVRTIIAGEF